MPVPFGQVPPDVTHWLEDLERRVGLLEDPQEPRPQFRIASANLSVANAATYINCAVFVSDLNILGHSNGSHWYREDTGAQIV